MNNLDAEIAAKIMGWIRTPDEMSGDGQGWYWISPEQKRIQETPKFSTEISAAWQVVEELACLPEESVRKRFIDRLLPSGLLVNREVAARNICLAALSAITRE
jgi:Phage ABA sandwich domain